MRFPMTAWLLVLLAFGAHAAEPDRRIAITIDDLPWQRMDKTPAADLPLRHAQLMAQLKQAGVPVVGFVNEGKLEIDGQVQPARVAMLRDWREAGYELGNHTHGHVEVLDLLQANPFHHRLQLLLTRVHANRLGQIAIAV